jgi:hypothetical protein
MEPSSCIPNRGRGGVTFFCKEVLASTPHLMVARDLQPQQMAAGLYLYKIFESGYNIYFKKELFILKFVPLLTTVQPALNADNQSSAYQKYSICVGLS